MPNFDGGHYFLTALIPISTDTLVERDGQRFSPIQMVRKALSILPTALQTPVTEDIGLNSPFSRNTRTHFARFVVVEDLMYNGRDPDDAIKASFDGSNPVLPQSQDSLSSPYLLFVADFDALSEDPGELVSYLMELWGTMEKELREVLGQCVGFQEVKNGTDFARYIRQGQVETTMSFNDYWTDAPPLKSQGTMLLAIGAGFALLGAAVGFKAASPGSRLGGAIAGGLAGGIVGLLLDYLLVMKKGVQPFETAPNSSLPSILKALYLQRKFTQFAIDMQGKDDSALHEAFASFLEKHQPDKLSVPGLTQRPGVIKS